MYDVRIGWGEGGPQKADEMNKISGFLTLGGVKKFENFAEAPLPFLCCPVKVEKFWRHTRLTNKPALSFSLVVAANVIV